MNCTCSEALACGLLHKGHNEVQALIDQAHQSQAPHAPTPTIPVFMLSPNDQGPFSPTDHNILVGDERPSILDASAPSPLPFFIR